MFGHWPIRAWLRTSVCLRMKAAKNHGVKRAKRASSAPEDVIRRASARGISDAVKLAQQPTMQETKQPNSHKRIRISDLLTPKENDEHHYEPQRRSSARLYSQASEVVFSRDCADCQYSTVQLQVPKDVPQRRSSDDWKLLKKMDHNETERIRRQRLKQKVEELRSTLPKEYAHCAATMVIDAASEEIDNLQEHLHELIRERNALLGSCIFREKERER